MIISKPKLISKSGSVATLVLLLVYGASSLRLDSIHQIFHAENIAELHSAKKESDPCHKNVYHQQKKSGCEHKSHITENTKCPVCEYSGSIKALVPETLNADIAFEQPIAEFFYYAQVHSPFIYRYAGRGPPQA